MIDWIATVIFLAGAACFTMAVSFGGTMFAWTSGTEIALWTMTGVLLTVTILLTIFHPGVTKENRLYPAHFLRRPILVILQLQVFLVSGIMLVGHHTYNLLSNMLTDLEDNDLLYTIVLPVPAGMWVSFANVDYDQHAQRLKGDGPLEAGIRLLPFIIFMVLFSMLNGALMPKLGYVTPWYSFGSAMILVGSALMCKISHSCNDTIIDLTMT